MIEYVVDLQLLPCFPPPTYSHLVACSCVCAGEKKFYLKACLRSWSGPSCSLRGALAKLGAHCTHRFEYVWILAPCEHECKLMLVTTLRSCWPAPSLLEPRLVLPPWASLCGDPFDGAAPNQHRVGLGRSIDSPGQACCGNPGSARCCKGSPRHGHTD